MQVVLTLFLFFLSIVNSVPVEPSSRQNKNFKLDRRTDGRAVFVQFTTKWRRTDKSGTIRTLVDLDSQDMRASVYHTSLEIQGDGASNGNIRVEIDLYSGLLPTDPIEYAVRIRDYGVGNSQAAPVTRYADDRFIKVYQAGTTSINNADLLDSTGKGIVADVWSANTQYSTIHNNCIDLVGNILKKMGLTPPPEIAGVFAETADPLLMYGRHGRIQASDVPVRLEQYPAGDSSNKKSWVFDVTDTENPIELQHVQGNTAVGEIKSSGEVVTGFSADNSIQQKLLSMQNLWNVFDINPFVENLPDPGEFSAAVAGAPEGLSSPFDEPWPFEDDADTPSTCLKRLRRSPGLVGRGACAQGQAPEENSRLTVSGSAEVALVRSGGVLSTVASFAGDSLTVLGVAALAVAAVFIILDIIDGQFQAAAFGAVGVAAGITGIAADLLAAGPIATLIGLAVGILFTLLPGLIDSFKDPGQTNNPAQIIQYTFFGDRSHTGK
jgi:hypothetical protein